MKSFDWRVAFDALELTGEAAEDLHKAMEIAESSFGVRALPKLAMRRSFARLQQHSQMALNGATFLWGNGTTTFR